jgi:GntR family transcriptional regulator/GntR family frlABCD operon transcriptional regulator
MEKENPQYIRLYNFLKRQILNNFYKEGNLLPSENDLCKLHHITRPTVRRALERLVNEGFIEKKQGKGSIVRSEPKQLGIMTIEGVTSAVKNEDLKTIIISKPSLTKWPEDFAYQLSNMEVEMGCIFIERVRLVNKNPVFYDKNYIPNYNLPRFTSRNLKNKSLFGILRENYNIEIKGGEQILRAIPADKSISQNLKIQPGHPILHLNRKLTTNISKFHIYSSLYCNTDKFRLHGVF